MDVIFRIKMRIGQKFKNKQMIETVVLIENGQYPFGEVAANKRTIKVEDIRSYDSLEKLKEQKIKMQNLFNSCDKTSQTTASFTENSSLIKLTKIYQEDLALHFVYQYVPYSLSQYIKVKLIPESDLEKSQIIQMNSKLFLKKVCYQLSNLAFIVVRKRLKTNLDYHRLGLDQEENLKFFVDDTCQILYSDTYNKQNSNPFIENQLKNFYEQQKQMVLFKLQAEFRKFNKIEQSVPNFVIQGNRLIFPESFIVIESQVFNPCSSSPSESVFTDRSQIFQPNCLNLSDSAKRVNGNLFIKPKKAQRLNYNTESNKKLQENLIKLQNLKKKSKRLNQQLKCSYLSNSQGFSANSYLKKQHQFNKRGSTKFQQPINKRINTQRGDDHWRNQKISEKFRKTHLPDGSRAKSPSRFGGVNFDGKRSKSNRSHKSSFQFKPKQREWFNPNKSFDNNIQDQFQQNSFQQSRSVRIQVEQKQTKERKSSFKVKILTCQEMEMDGENLEEFVFQAMNKNFNKFSDKQDENSSNKSENGKKSNRNRSSQYSQKLKNVFSQKFKSQLNRDFNKKNEQSTEKESFRNVYKEKKNESQSSQKKNIFERFSEHFGNEKQKAAKNSQLEQKIKLAKQKAQNILNQYMKNKKCTAKSSKSKYGL